MLEHKRWRDLVGADDWHHLAVILFLPGRPARLHTHDFPEIFWIERGEGRHHINGGVKKLRAGDLVFVRPPDRHRLEAVNAAGFTLVNLAFHPRLRTDLLRRYPDTFGPLLASRDPLPCREELTPAALASLRVQLMALGGRRASRLEVEHFLLGLPGLLQPAANADTVLPRLPDWLRRACEEAQRPEVFVRGAPGLAQVAGRSPEHVARTVRKLLGMPPSEFINRIRMEHAARELRVTARPIADIALDCGLNNLSHFYALFRRAHRTTPRAYRLLHHRTIA